jgi:radical SAM protein with 4Fe4S-binding SPASM domain
MFTSEKIERCLPNLSWIRFSVDSGSAENYSQIHRTTPKDFAKLIDNLEKSVDFKNQNELDVTIGVQFLMLPQNIKEATKLAKLLKKIGVDNLQIKPYSHHPDSLNKFIVNPKQYNRLEKQLKIYGSEDFTVNFRRATIERITSGNNYKECYGLPFFALIDAKGNLVPCNLFYDNEEFTYGNLYENSFSQIWKSEKRKEILKKLKKRGTNNCREGCRLDSSNRYLDRLKKPYPHDNFI